MVTHLTLLPTTGCPASCTYCFGPHASGRTMPLETIRAVVDWQNSFRLDDKVEITFHGGEPLAAGLDYYKKSLPILREGFATRDVSFALQSNLWLLTDEFCDIFGEYGVSIGTSLDGPEAINDAQRGTGYYQRTSAGIQRAWANGKSVGCICTFTSQSAQYSGETFEFFLRNGLDFSIHAAVPLLGRRAKGWALSPDAHGRLLIEMLDRYLANSSQIRISTLDSMCQSVSVGRGGVCTFGDCLGDYLAIDPEGWIYPCQRLAGMANFRLGNVHQRPSMESLHAALVWQMFRSRQEHVRSACGDCAHFEYCRGGCPYNALAANSGRFDDELRDPHCPAYKRVFEYITERALQEVFSEQNLAMVATNSPSRHGMLQKGKLLQIMRGDPHPKKVHQQARKVVSAVALAASPSLEEAVDKLEQVGLVTDRRLAAKSIEALQSQLRKQTSGLFNAYIHVTYACNLNCNHCYAASGPQQAGQAMPVEDVIRLVNAASQAGFRKAVITGGEPLAHPHAETLLDRLAEARQTASLIKVVLRTNLANQLTHGLLEKLSNSADQIVVSIDGSEATHDDRRGRGTYARAVTNLRSLLSLKEPSSLVIGATLGAAQIAGADGDAVRALGRELGVDVRFKPILPLGRAAETSGPPEFYSSLQEDCSGVVSKACLSTSCGLGMNLYIGPGGECFPCYALTGAAHALGNALANGLTAVLSRNDAYRQVTVDSNEKCSTCALRYLCGGFCRAWSRSQAPDSPPEDCRHLQARAQTLLQSALYALDISSERWRAVGLAAE